MSLRIACDLDGTVADMERALQREAEALYGPDVDLRAGQSMPLVPLQSPANFANGDPPAAGAESPPPASPQTGKRPLTDRERRGLWAHVGRIENFWFALKEVERGAVARFGAQAMAHRWEVLFLTQRPEGAGNTPQRQSQAWLQVHGFEHPAVFVMNGSRGKVADALSLDVVIDDRPDNCLDVVTDSTARAILVWRDDPATVPPAARRMGIIVVHSFSEALDYLETMRARQAKSRGLLGRIRNAIGV